MIFKYAYPGREDKYRADIVLDQHADLGYDEIKLRMEMRNVSKRQQPDHRTDNSRSSPTGL